LRNAYNIYILLGGTFGVDIKLGTPFVVDAVAVSPARGV
jgi:hypothetical protein